MPRPALEVEREWLHPIAHRLWILVNRFKLGERQAMIVDINLLCQRIHPSILWPRSNRVSGFSLVELSIVLMLSGILLSALLPTITQAQRAWRYWQTEKRLDESIHAILGFAIMHRRLPCPASAKSKGLEDCHSDEDWLPGRSLQINGAVDSHGRLLDGWGSPIRYRAGRDAMGLLFEDPVRIAALDPHLWQSSLGIQWQDGCTQARTHANELAAIVFANNRVLAKENNHAYTFGRRVTKGLCPQDNSARWLSEHRLLLEWLYSSSPKISP